MFIYLVIYIKKYRNINWYNLVFYVIFYKRNMFIELNIICICISANKNNYKAIKVINYASGFIFKYINVMRQ